MALKGLSFVRVASWGIAALVIWGLEGGGGVVGMGRRWESRNWKFRVPEREQQTFVAEEGQQRGSSLVLLKLSGLRRFWQQGSVSSLLGSERETGEFTVEAGHCGFDCERGYNVKLIDTIWDG
jgi:hypothetical protein